MNKMCDRIQVHKNDPALTWHCNNVFYNGNVIGSWLGPSANYPQRYTIKGGKTVGTFTSKSDGAMAILINSGVLGTTKTVHNVYPDDQWILRMSDIALIMNPKPDSPVKASALITYNHFNATGSSAASMPVRKEVMQIDTDKMTFVNRNGKAVKFANSKEMIQKALEAACAQV